MVRTPTRDESGLKKGTWTPEEDRKLIAYVTRYGCWNWRQLPKFAGLSRCGKSCRLRWLNYLRPNIKRGNYTKEEEETIIRLHEKMGNRWSAIAGQLPGRTDNEVKNHWHTTLKKRLRQHKDSIKTKQISSHDNDHDHGSSSELESTKQKSTSDSNPNDVNDYHLRIPAILDPQISSPQPTSSDQFSSISTDIAAAVTSTESFVVADDNIAFFDAYEEPIGNFWTEPFLADNDFIDAMIDQYPIFDSEIL